MGSLSEQVECLKENIFHTSQEDNETSLSFEDRKFLDTVETKIHKNETGHWEMPLPFHWMEMWILNNCSQAVNCLKGLLRTLKKKPQMEKDYLTFMEKIFNKGHASPVPQEKVISKNQSGQVWYPPHFRVYHVKSENWVVFESSTEFEGVSLNKELLSGPNMMNSLQHNEPPPPAPVLTSQVCWNSLLLCWLWGLSALQLNFEPGLASWLEGLLLVAPLWLVLPYLTRFSGSLANGKNVLAKQRNVATLTTSYSESSSCKQAGPLRMELLSQAQR